MAEKWRRPPRNAACFLMFMIIVNHRLKMESGPALSGANQSGNEMDNEVKHPSPRKISMRTIATVAMFLFWIFIGWYSGIDYTVRGTMQATHLLLSVVCTVAAYAFPVWAKDGSIKW